MNFHTQTRHQTCSVGNNNNCRRMEFNKKVHLHVRREEVLIKEKRGKRHFLMQISSKRLIKMNEKEQD